MLALKFALVSTVYYVSNTCFITCFILLALFAISRMKKNCLLLEMYGNNVWNKSDC